MNFYSELKPENKNCRFIVNRLDDKSKVTLMKTAITGQ